jgi:methyl-galactoside transport system substrate-binding protein
MKRLLLIFILSLILVSCGSDESAEVPLIIYDMEDDYMQSFEAQIHNAASQRINIQTYDSGNSQLTQNEQVKMLINESRTPIIVNPVDRLGVHAMINEASTNNIPLIFINREPLYEDLNSYEQSYYIGSDPKESAYLQAEIIMEMFGTNPYLLNHFDKNGDNKIQNIILMGQQGHQDAEQRTKYVIEALEDEDYSLDILDILVADFDYQTAYDTIMDSADTYDKDIELIIANNDAMALGAVDALIELGLIEDTNEDGSINHFNEPYIPVVGIDGLSEAISYIENGYLYGTVTNDSLSMSLALIDLVDALLNDTLDELEWTITNDHYIWIEYQAFFLEQNTEDDTEDTESALPDE